MASFLVCLMLAAVLPLEKGFQSPPHSAKPHVWWDWINGNVSEYGISADLSALAENGFSGFTVRDIGGGTPRGPVDFGSEKWFGCIEFAVKEAIRLNLEVCLANGSGWSSSGGPWVSPKDSMKCLTWTSVDVEGPGRFNSEMPKPKDKFGFCSDIAIVAQSREDPDRCVLVSKECDKKLDWRIPGGKWTIYRFAYAANGKKSVAASRSGKGFECDKFDASAFERHFDAYIGKIVGRLKAKGLYCPKEGRGLVSVLVDSYEVRDQNWTHGFERIFSAKRGYDPLPFLPYIANTNALTKKAKSFRRDMAVVCEELFEECYTGEMKRKCHENGLRFVAEPYGRNMPGFERSFKDSYHKATDVPMTEFWAIEQTGGHWRRSRRIARLAHKTGKRIVAAEAFTAWPHQDRWSLSPFDLKASGDMAFKCGVNQLHLHTFVHQPWGDHVKPGMTMDQFGTHFDRNSTLWPMAKEWTLYLARCQYLLQEGKPGASWRDDIPHRVYSCGTDGFFVATTNRRPSCAEFRFPVFGRTPELWDPASGTVTIARDWRECGRETFVSVPLGPCGSVFVMFPPVSTKGACILPEYEVVTEQKLAGPWRMRMGDKEFSMETLSDWAAFPDDNVRYFSGTAEYSFELELSDAVLRELSREGSTCSLDLGDVKCLAEVTVNGRGYPVLWKPPFVLDVAESVKSAGKGRTTISVKVANLWANRLIGDEFLPGDVRRSGPYAKSIPSWVIDGSDTPAKGRSTFSVYRHWTKKDTLLPSGLLGPVVLKVNRAASCGEPKVQAQCGAACGLRAVSPCDGAVVQLLNDNQRHYLSLPLSEREKYFADDNDAKKVAMGGEFRSYGTKPEPVTLKWSDDSCPKAKAEVCVKRVPDGRVFFRGVVSATNAVDVWNLEIAREWEWTVKCGQKTAAGRFRTADAAPRFLKIDNISNCRDIGGRIGLGGRRVRQGLVLRTQGMNANAKFKRKKGSGELGPIVEPPTKRGPDRLTGEARRFLLEDIGVRTDLDLRNEYECFGMDGSPLGPSVVWYRNSLVAAYSLIRNPLARKTLAEVFRIFLEEKNYPVVLHCIGGADRTGCISFVLNALLGVPIDELYKDYEATAMDNSFKAGGLADQKHWKWFNGMVAGFNAYPGETIREKVENGLKSLGFTDADFKKYREIMLEPSAAITAH